MIARSFASLRENFAALEERNFRLLWLGQTGSTIGDGLTFVALAFAVLSIGGTATDIGIVFVAFFLPNVIFLLAGGVWADRLPRNLVTLTSDAVRAIVQISLAVLLVTGSAQVWMLVIATALHGAASAFFVPASTGLMPQVVSPGRLQQANALMALSRGAAFIVGPALSGLLVAAGGPGLVFGIDAVTYVLSIVTLALLRIERPAQPAERATFIHELVEGWREVRSRDWLLTSLVAFGVSNAAMGSFFVLGPVILNAQPTGPAEWGFILTIGALGALIGGAVALRWKAARPLLVGFAVMLVGATRTLALIPPMPALVIALTALATMAAITISNTLWETVLQQRIPQAALSRVSSYDWMVSLAFQPLAFVIIGPLADTIGNVQTLLLASAVALAANLGVLLIPSVRNMRRFDLDPEPGAPVNPEISVS